MDHVIYFVGSGVAFFVGVAFVMLGVAISPFIAGRALQLARNLAVFIGGVLVAISAAPLDWWLYALLGALTAIWLPLEWCKAIVPRKTVITGRLGVLSIWLFASAIEMPYQITPSLPPMGNPKLLLIGDSVSAGVTEKDKGTWPKRLAQDHGIEVKDCSKMGATVGSRENKPNNSAMNRASSCWRSAATMSSARLARISSRSDLSFC